jgi:transcription antitermination protein NusB
MSDKSAKRNQNLGLRRQARQRTVQYLFQHEINPPENMSAALDFLFSSQQAEAVFEDKAGMARWGEEQAPVPITTEQAAIRLFAEPLIQGVLEHRDQLDAEIKKHAKNWDLHRMAAVDRNILRLAIYEMLYREDIPPVVSINEAVEIAKLFSTDDSGRFVNGILDKVRQELMRPAREVK